MNFKTSGVVALLSLLAALGARAQTTVHLAFSGGNGTPLSVRFVDPLQLTTTQATSSVMLVMHGIYPGSMGAGDSSPTVAPTAQPGPSTGWKWPGYTVNGAADAYEDQGFHPLTDWNLAAGSLSTADFVIKLSQDTNNTNAIAAGSVYLISAGFSFTTGSSNWASNPADYSATFDIYLNNAFGGRISAIQAGALGTSAVPEPAAYAMVGGIAALAVGALARRKRS